MEGWIGQEYYELAELTAQWEIHGAHLKRWLISGILQAVFWLPVCSVYAEEHGEKGTRSLHHYEGFVLLNPQHCQRLYRSGHITLRHFQGRCGTQHYVLPDSSEDIRIQERDLLVLPEEYERVQQAGLVSAGTSLINSNPDFREVTLGGETHYFGEMQAEILRRLYEAAQRGEPWQNGKRLLQEVGSESFSLSNVFKHKPIWREFIHSNKRGAYRLRPDWLDPVKGRDL